MIREPTQATPIQDAFGFLNRLYLSLDGAQTGSSRVARAKNYTDSMSNCEARISSMTLLGAVSSDALTQSDVDARLYDLYCAEPLTKPIVSGLLVFQNLGLFALLFDEATRWMGALGLGLATAARIITQLRENLGWSLVVMSPIMEVKYALRWLLDRRPTSIVPI